MDFDKLKKPKKHKKALDYTQVMIILAIIVCVIALSYSAYKNSAPAKATMAFPEFLDNVDTGNVAKINFITNKKYFTATFTDGKTYTIIDPGDDDFRREMLEAGVEVEVATQTAIDAITQVFSTLPMIILSFAILLFITKTLGSQTYTLFKLYKGEEIIKFDDVAGMTETKQEVMFAVSQLKNASKLKELGARPCKGIILEGPPGTGKTLLAKAIAGEANVPFISTSGADFIEMFAGLGAARVRKLWDLALINAPCVVFIDEIDAVGRRRTGGGDGAQTEANQTLNELLAKMDGLGTNSGVFVVGATNRIQDLDPALLRPGRFDKHLYVGPPKTKADRDEIMNLYLKTKKLDKNFDTDKASKLLFGFSGAEIEQVLNEAVLVSLQRGGDGIISVEDVDASAMKMIASGVAVKHSSKIDTHITSVHEAGHAVMNSILGRKVSKVSIIPYNSGIGGLTIRDTDDIEDIKMSTKTDLLNDIKVLLAGRVAELLLLGDTSIGCSNDLEKATNIAYRMIYNYAMTSDYIINPEVIKTDGVAILDSKEIIENTNRLVLDCEKDVKEELQAHLDDIKALANRLETEENVYDYSI